MDMGDDRKIPFVQEVCLNGRMWGENEYGRKIRPMRETGRAGSHTHPRIPLFERIIMPNTSWVVWLHSLPFPL